MRYKYDLNINQYSLIASFIFACFSEKHNLINIYEIGSRDCADAFLLDTLISNRFNVKINCFDAHDKFFELSNPFALASQNIKRYNYALGDKTEKIKFFQTDTAENNKKSLNDMGIGASSLKEPILNIDKLPTKSFNSVEVDCFKAAEKIDEIGAPDVLILDVQGAELDVLRGFDDHLRNSQLIFMECNIKKNMIYKEDVGVFEVTDFLKRKGFRLIKVYNVSKYSCDCVFSQRKNLNWFLTYFAYTKLLTLSSLRSVYSNIKRSIHK